LFRVMAVVFVAWLPYVVMSWPGNVTNDSGSGILYYYGIDRSNPNNPFFQNILMGSWLDIWSRILGSSVMAVSLYCLCQMVIEIIVISTFWTYLYQKQINRLALYAVLILYCLVPAFPLYSLTMGKDSNLGIAVMAYEYFALQAVIETEQYISERHILFKLSIMTIIISLLRNHAGILGLSGILILLLYKKDKKTSICMFSTSIMVLICTSIFPYALGMPKPEIKESMSIPLQTVAYYVNTFPEELSDADLEAIYSIIPQEAILAYDPEIADPVKNPAKLTKDNIYDFLDLWLGMLCRHPLAMLKAFYRSTNAYYIPHITTSVRVHVWIGFMVISPEAMAILTAGEEIGFPYRNTLENIDRMALNLPVLGLFSKIGLYSWALLYGLFLIVHKKMYRYLHCIVPLLLIFLGCLFSPVNGYYRYAYSYILSTPIVMAAVLFLKLTPHTGTASTALS